MNAVSSRLTFILFLFFALSSCSVFSFKRAGEGQTTPAISDDGAQVPKKEYDDLKAKYESLLQASQAGGTIAPDGAQNLLSDLSSAKGSESFQTVDVFSDYPQEIGQAGALTGSVAKTENADGPIDQEMAQLAKITVLLGRKDFDNAMNMLKPLENSKVKQVQTQAKFLLAESLFLQNEFDLAMQVYEEIIRKDAYSSLVLRSLGRLIVCAEKLKIDDKKEKYYSLLHDFFEAS